MFDERSRHRVSKAVGAYERSARSGAWNPNRIMPVPDRVGCRFRNDSGETIPAHAMMLVTHCQSAAILSVGEPTYFIAKKPGGTITSQTIYGVNGNCDVASGDYGACFLANHAWPVIVLWDSTATPVIHPVQGWELGPVVDEWYASEDGLEVCTVVGIEQINSSNRPTRVWALLHEPRGTSYVQISATVLSSSTITPLTIPGTITEKILAVYSLQLRGVTIGGPTSRERIVIRTPGRYFVTATMGAHLNVATTNDSGALLVRRNGDRTGFPICRAVIAALEGQHIATTLVARGLCDLQADEYLDVRSGVYNSAWSGSSIQEGGGMLTVEFVGPSMNPNGLPAGPGWP